MSNWYAKAKEKREERNTLVADANDILKAAHEDGKRNLTEDESAKFDEMHEKGDKLLVEAQRFEKQGETERDIAEAKSQGESNEDNEKRHAKAEGDRKEERKLMSEDERRYEELFYRHLLGIGGAPEMETEERSFFRTQSNKLAEKRAQGTTPGSVGGFTIPEGFSGSLEIALALWGGMRENAQVITTATGNDLPWPTVNDTAQTGEILTENTQVNEQDVTFAELIFHAYTYSSKLVRVSWQLLQDSSFDMQSLLTDLFARRIGTIQNLHYTTGDGASKPNGVLTAGTLGKTAAANNDITFAEVDDLYSSVDPVYRAAPMAKFMFNDATLAVLRQKVDATTGRPLWLPGFAVEAPDTILGKPYFINQDTPSIATVTKVMAFGDFSKYVIRDARGFLMVRLDERYADFHQTGFLAYARSDGDLLDAGTNPIKYLQMAV